MALAKRTVPGRLAPGPNQLDDTCWLLYTGGTTGVPKAAELSERAIAQLAMSVSVGWDLPHHRRYLACAPISHAAGMLITPTLLAGGTIVLQRGFDPDAWIAAVSAEQATVTLLVPTMIYVLLDSPRLDGADLSSLRTVMYGASPMAPARMLEALERIGPVFCQLYVSPSGTCRRGDPAGVWLSPRWGVYRTVKVAATHLACDLPAGAELQTSPGDRRPAGVR